MAPPERLRRSTASTQPTAPSLRRDCCLGTDENFYGTTSLGGGAPHRRLGTIFKITSGGKLTTLHSFAGYPTEGTKPTRRCSGHRWELLRNRVAGRECGTVFRSPRRSLTTLHSFCAQRLRRRNVPRRRARSGRGRRPLRDDRRRRDRFSQQLTFGCGTIFKITSAGHTDDAAQLRRHY